MKDAARDTARPAVDPWPGAQAALDAVGPDICGSRYAAALVDGNGAICWTWAPALLRATAEATGWAAAQRNGVPAAAGGQNRPDGPPAVPPGWRVLTVPVAVPRPLSLALYWRDPDPAPRPSWLALAAQLAAARLRAAAAEAQVRALQTALAAADHPSQLLLVGPDGQPLFAGESVRRLLGLDQVRDLTTQLPFLWQRVQAVLSSRQPHTAVLAPPAVSTPCHATISPLPDQAGTAGVVIRLARSEERAHGQQAAGRLQARYRFEHLITESAAMQRVVELARLAAGTDATILLTGQSGTGKELLAQAIHNASNRTDGPFVALNCGSIPHDLVASELFGYEGGAFTGARREGSAGKFEIASGGTLFLDEIGEMPAELQVHLLRVLEERSLMRVGGHRVVPVDVHIIAATNRDLAGEVSAGHFRSDLYYRLNVMTIHLPPLRQRPEDIAAMARTFLAREGHPGPVDPRVESALLRYPWPGNARELYNVIKRATLLAMGQRVELHHLPADITARAGGMPLGPADAGALSLDYSERLALIRALESARGNVAQTSRTLGVARSTLYRKLRRHGLSLPKG